MSCEGSQHAFWSASGARADVAAAFGGAAAATQALEEVFAIARARAERSGTADHRSTLVAEAATRALFAEMRDQYQLKPPAHASNGLPKDDAQHGYLAVYQTLRAITEGRDLPELAAQVRQAQQRVAGTPVAQIQSAPIPPHETPLLARAALDQATKIVAYNRDGYDADGYNRLGYNDQGYNRQNKDRQGYDAYGLDAKGYNRHGYDRNGYDRQGLNPAGYNRNGLDANGRNVMGYKQAADGRWTDREDYDTEGYDANGYDRIGVDHNGKDRQGIAHPFFASDVNGRYADGLDAAGYDAEGYRDDGRDRYGFDKAGYNPWGYDRNGYTRYGVHISAGKGGGYDSYGFRTDPTGQRRDRLGFDAAGFDASGYRITGYDKHGKDRNGNHRSLTLNPKTGKWVEAKYNRTGWDQFGYDRTGINKTTGLTAPDTTGQRRNLWGWVYDEATRQVVNPNDPTQRLPHVPLGFNRYERLTHYAAYKPPVPPTPITPLVPMTFDEVRATVPTNVLDSNLRSTLDARRSSTIGERWATARAAYDPKATRGGVRLRCPACGQFTGGTGHICAAQPPDVGSVITYASGVVQSTARGIIATPHTPSYDPEFDTNGGYSYSTGYDRQGYDNEGFNRDGRDRDGYTKEGYDLFGFDREGYDRRGYNKDKRDRDGNLRPRTVEDAARGLDDGDDPINNKHLANLYSRIASTLRGQKRTVVFGEDGSGFATDMKGTIYADPYPLGHNAPDAHNLVVIKGGIYHEIAHEQFTPPEIWAAVLDIARSPMPMEGLDAGRGLLPTMYNIIEDGGIERLLSSQYTGVAEVLAASCALQPRWGEHVGPEEDTGGQVMGALLYTALPYYRVSDAVRAGMSPDARTLFNELEPVVAAAVRGASDDRFRAAVYVTRRFEEEGLLKRPPADMKATPPPPPPPGTQQRTPQGQQGQQGQQGEQQGDQQDQGGQQGGQQGSQQGGGSSGNGQSAYDQNDQHGGGGGRGTPAADDGEGGSGRRRAAADNEQPTGRQRSAAQDDEQAWGRQRGSDQDDEQNGAGGQTGNADDTDDQVAQNGSSSGSEPGDQDCDGDGGAAEGHNGQDSQGNQQDNSQSGQEGQGNRQSGQEGQAGQGDQQGDGQQHQQGTSPTAGGTSGSGSTIGSGGTSLRDVERSFSDADIADIIAATEREAANAIDAGVRASSSISGMGSALHRPLGNADRAEQRYRTPDGRPQTVSVVLPTSQDQALMDNLAARRPAHKKIASDLARQLQAVREETDKVIRFQNEGSLDRRRAVAAIKGSKDVKKQRQPVPQTRFAASISVDLSGSMASQIRSGNLFDATMILGDTFENLEIPYEVRGIGSDSSVFKSMDDVRFAPERAAQLAESSRGGTNMAHTSGLASTALRACEEHNKLLIALTDGAAGDHAQTVKVLQEARKQGVVTFGMYLGTNPPKQQLDELYGPGNWVPINDLKEMPVAVGKRLVSTFKRLASRRG